MLESYPTLRKLQSPRDATLVSSTDADLFNATLRG